jgi:hypothetical protein
MPKPPKTMSVWPYVLVDLWKYLYLHAQLASHYTTEYVCVQEVSNFQLSLHRQKHTADTWIYFYLFK